MLKWLRRSACRRRRSGQATILLFQYAAVTAALIAFLPILQSFQRSVSQLAVRTRAEQQAVITQGLLDNALLDFVRDVSMPPLCANPAGAEHDDECLTFGAAHSAPMPWSQQDIDVSLRTLYTGVLPITAYGAEARQPICFVSRVQSAGRALGDDTDLGMQCVMWVPPGRPRSIEATLDPTGYVIIRRHQPVASLNELRPVFDLNSGRDAEIFIDDVAAFKAFWYDSNGVVTDVASDGILDDWRVRLACTTTTTTCSNDVSSGALDASVSSNLGIARLVLLMCPPHSADLNQDNEGDCVTALRGATDPLALGTLGYRYELSF